MLRPAGIPEGFAASNGRIEATEVDIATKIAGRIDTILVSEGQFVRQGEVLAKMDTRVLQEQRLEAIATNQRGRKRGSGGAGAVRTAAK
jgi:HlyD family secretion protein.